MTILFLIFFLFFLPEVHRRTVCRPAQYYSDVTTVTVVWIESTSIVLCSLDVFFSTCTQEVSQESQFHNVLTVLLANRVQW